MENGNSTTTNKSHRIHPLVATAAVSVTLFSLLGVAAITGVLPTTRSNNGPATEATTAATTPNANNLIGLAPNDKTPGVSSATSSASPAPMSKPPAHHASHPAASYNAPVAQAPVCHSCGHIVSITPVQQTAKPSGLGIAGGAVLGGILGNQVGAGNGRTLATVAGAVGGGYAGNEVEKRMHTTTTYHVHVRMEDGTTRTFTEASQGEWQVGERVRVVNGRLTAQG
jgi:outer membrane lipoprotein SlyB